MILNLAKMARVISAARACVQWVDEHDKGLCIHGIHNSDCRGCANEPPLFPMGIDEFFELSMSLHDLDGTNPFVDRTAEPSSVSQPKEEP